MAKGYGIIAVLIGHMVQGSVLGVFVYSFHLPLFFFLSGYLFKSSDKFTDFLKKKCRSILLPYFTLGILVVLCSAFYPLIFRPYPFTKEQVYWALRDNIIGYLTQYRYTTLWFLSVLFGVNILMFFVCKIKNEIIQPIIVVILFVASMLYYYYGGSELFWNIDVAFPALLFFWVGFAMRKYNIIEGKLSGASKLPLFAIGFLIVNIIFNILTITITGQGLEMYRCSYAFVPFTIISAFAGIMFIVAVSILTTSKPILYIGKNSLI